MLLNIYVTLLICLFLYTGAQSTLRQIQSDTVNEAFHINFDTENTNDILKQNEYIHSAWLYSDTKKQITFDNTSQNIPESFTPDNILWIKHGLENDKDSIFWDKPFVYDDIVLIPYVKSIENGCIGVMFPFYL